LLLALHALIDRVERAAQFGILVLAWLALEYLGKTRHKRIRLHTRKRLSCQLLAHLPAYRIARQRFFTCIFFCHLYLLQEQACDGNTGAQTALARYDRMRICRNAVAPVAPAFSIERNQP